jgi:RNA polymerase sigma-70 factor (ECF subfamily)
MRPAGDERNRDRSGGFDSPAEASLRVADPDVRLMLAFRDGDAAAFEELFQRWASPLLRYLERMLRDAAAAEELVQEVFLRVHRARERYAPEARFSTWLYRIATNLALNELRRPRRRDPHASADDDEGVWLVDPGSATDEIAHARRLGRAALRELEALPERQRAALWLTAVEGLAYAEVATALGVSEKAVKALVHRGRSALADKLQPGV